MAEHDLVAGYFKNKTSIFISMKALLFVVFFLSVTHSDLFDNYPLHHGLSTFERGERRSIEAAEAVEYIETAKDAIDDSLFQRIHELTTDYDDPFAENDEKTKEMSLFHNYDSHAYVLVGTADVNFLKSILEKDNYLPIGLGKSLEGVVMIWMRNRIDSTLGEEVELQVTILASPKKFGYLGVSYDGVNEASVLFPFFGKLEDHSRLYVFHRSTDNEHSERFGREVFEMPGELHTSQLHVGPDRGDEKKSGNFLDFEFYREDSNKLIMKGKFKLDDSWMSWGSSSWKILKALGLSGVLDLWYAPKVSYKKISPVTEGSKDGYLTTVHTDFRKQRFYEINEQYDFELGIQSSIGRELKVMKFKPKMIVKTENLQEAFVVPRKQSEDLDFLTTRLMWESRADDHEEMEF